MAVAVWQWQCGSGRVTGVVGVVVGAVVVVVVVAVVVVVVVVVVVAVVAVAKAAVAAGGGGVVVVVVAVVVGAAVFCPRSCESQRQELLVFCFCMSIILKTAGSGSWV